jgi:hypothetical protein
MYINFFYSPNGEMKLSCKKIGVQNGLSQGEILTQIDPADILIISQVFG